MSDNKEIFEYTYSAPTEEEKKQIESIRREYLGEGKTLSPFEKLKKLNAKVKDTATIVALIFGIVGCLVFGLGLTMVLEWQIWIWGVVLMAIGTIPMLIAYPAYNLTLSRGKKKYGKEILELTEELLKK
ncbi:MAG: hypothetical protein IKA85_07435 [Clostridia bacterium]|nr:hypothetical protein [Clostridia bacterium]